MSNRPTKAEIIVQLRCGIDAVYKLMAEDKPYDWLDYFGKFIVEHELSFHGDASFYDYLVDDLDHCRGLMLDGNTLGASWYIQRILCDISYFETAD